MNDRRVQTEQIKVGNKYIHLLFGYVVTVIEVKQTILYYTYDYHSGFVRKFDTRKDFFLKDWRKLTKLERALR